jgi:hypothetical protein
MTEILDVHSRLHAPGFYATLAVVAPFFHVHLLLIFPEWSTSTSWRMERIIETRNQSLPDL